LVVVMPMPLQVDLIVFDAQPGSGLLFFSEE